MNPYAVPAQNLEQAIDARHSVQLFCERDACDFFDRIKQKLLDVNQWSDYAGDLPATFELLSQEGRIVYRAARLGDYLKIDLPGSDGQAGDGCEWFMIEDMQLKSTRHSESFSFRVRPVSHPVGEHEAIAHFYGEEATSTFEVSRSKQTVGVAIYDRNIIQATAPGSPDELPDGIIRTGVATFSTIPWLKLAKGLLRSAPLFKFLISLPF